MTLRDIRSNYDQGQLLEKQASADPFAQLQLWLQQALDANLADATAMTLITQNERGHPTGRVVLIKELDARGVVWYTNYNSRKGQELARQPQAALLFFWPSLQRQVRLEGTVEKVSAEESDAYWQVRPFESQVGAWVSPQSQVIPDRQWLEDRNQELLKEYQGRMPPRPAYWGGYRLIPQYWEFWQGRPSRLHDRLVYQPAASGTWRLQRLAP